MLDADSVLCANLIECDLLEGSGGLLRVRARPTPPGGSEQLAFRVELVSKLELPQILEILLDDALRLRKMPRPVRGP